MNAERPLDGIASIKVKLGVLVGASVVVATLVAEVGDAASVPWWTSVPVTVAAALAVTQWLARGMTSPLREMTQAAGAMAGGDYGQRVTASSSDEVGDLARAFNAMSADLASADMQRRQLVATVSHELRTPLAAQRALLENLVDGVVRPDDAALEAALTQSERLSALVGDLLDLSRIDAGAAPLALTDVRVAELVGTAVSEALVGGRAVRVVHDVQPADLTVRADPARLAQLVANLVDNAVRHSPPGGEVRVVARRADDVSWWLEVRDEGPGIPADRADRRLRPLRLGWRLRGRHRARARHRELGLRAARRERRRAADRARSHRSRPPGGAAPAAADDPTHPPHPGDHDEPTAQSRDDPGRRGGPCRGRRGAAGARRPARRSGRRWGSVRRPLAGEGRPGAAPHGAGRARRGGLGGAHLAGAQRRGWPSR